MSLAYPLGLALAALAVPLVLLYVLKLRRRPVSVSSTLLWRRVVEDRRANAPWERLRRHLLLLLQLLILAALVLAFAGPFVRSEASLAGATVIVLDGSASLHGATADGRARFDVARDEVARLLRAVDRSRSAALVLAGPEPEVLSPLSGDAARLGRALERASPTEAPADLAASLELARTLVRNRPDGEVLLVTDGSFDADDRLDLAGIRVVVIDEPRSNRGIVSVALRHVAGAALGHELFAGVRATGGAAESATLVLEAATGAASSTGAPDGWGEVGRAQLVLEPEAHHSQLFAVTASEGTLLRLRLEGESEDALELDDEVLLVVPPPPRARVLLVSRAPWLLQRALAAVPGVELFVGEDVPEDAGEFDLVVLDGVVPDVLPSCPVLAFGARAAAEAEEPAPLVAAERVENPRVLRWDRRHPALRHVALDAVRIERAWRTRPPPHARLLVESDRGPLVATWEAAGGPVLAFSFDLVASDLPLRVAFPVLVHDAVDWLTGRDLGAAVLPAGRPHVVRLGERPPVVRWTSPGTETVELRPDGSTLRLPAPRRLGLHRLEWGAGETEPARGRRVAVALLSAEESDLRPRVEAGDPPAASSGGGEAAAVRRAPGRRFLWPWLVSLALLVALVEWAVHHRRAG